MKTRRRRRRARPGVHQRSSKKSAKRLVVYRDANRVGRLLDLKTKNKNYKLFQSRLANKRASDDFFSFGEMAFVDVLDVGDRLYNGFLNKDPEQVQSSIRRLLKWKRYLRHSLPTSSSLGDVRFVDVMKYLVSRILRRSAKLTLYNDGMKALIGPFCPFPVIDGKRGSVFHVREAEREAQSSQ